MTPSRLAHSAPWFTNPVAPAGGALYLTADLSGVGGVLKARPEDFYVEETPLYEPSGEGEHLYLFVEKKNLSTTHMIRLIADHFRVRRGDVGVAGLKDKHAVTRQYVSVHLPGKKESDYGPLEEPAIEVLWTGRHNNKLRRGHLKSNRFVIRIRDVEPSKVIHAHRVLKVLAQRGVPNRIGAQRFGHLAHNHLVGLGLVLGDDAMVLRHLLGPSVNFPDSQREAREAFAAGNLAKAYELLPRAAHTEHRVLAALEKSGGDAHRAVRAIEPLERSFFVTATQSAIFNHVLDQRLQAGAFDRVGAGDIATKHENGAMFAVDDAVAADPETARRLAALEISSTGPMWSSEMMRAGGAVAESELRALEETGITEAALVDFAKRDRDAPPGSRRSLRMPIMTPDIEGGVDEHGPYIRCRFELLPGSFATTVMAEIMKTSSAAEEEA